MIVGDTLGLALRNLRQAKLRTTLTTLGVSIGIASLAGMVSLGVGLEDQIVGRFTASGLFDSISVVASQGTLGVAGRAGQGGRGFRGALRAGGAGRADTPRRDLDDRAIADIRGVEHVSEVYPDVRVPADVSYGGHDASVAVTGVPMSSRGKGAFQTMAFGTFFTSETDDACLLTLDMAKRLTDADPKDLIDQRVTITYAAANAGVPGMPAAAPVAAAGTTCRVAGIVESEPGGPFGGGVSGVMVPLPKALELDAAMPRSPSGPSVDTGSGPSVDTGAGRTYGSLTIKVARAEFTSDVEDRVKAMGFTAVSINDALQGAKRAFLVLDIVLSLIGSIALAVSSLGIVNTMVMSILERTREIGIMKAVGGSDADIRRVFLVEASVIGLAGGAAGVALGWLVGRIINFGANIYIQSQGGAPGNLFSLPGWLIGGAIAFSWIVSLIAGSYPASRAARLDPIQALRHD